MKGWKLKFNSKGNKRLLWFLCLTTVRNTLKRKSTVSKMVKKLGEKKQIILTNKLKCLRMELIMYKYIHIIHIYSSIYNLYRISLARRGGLDPARFSTPLMEPPLRYRTRN